MRLVPLGGLGVMMELNWPVRVLKGVAYENVRVKLANMSPAPREGTATDLMNSFVPQKVLAFEGFLLILDKIDLHIQDFLS